MRKRATMAEEIEKALHAIGHGLEINIGVAGLNLWIRKRDRAIEAHGKLLAAERECREAQIETNGSRERVAKALRSAGVDISRNGDASAMLAARPACASRAAAPHKPRDRLPVPHS